MSLEKLLNGAASERLSRQNCQFSISGFSEVLAGEHELFGDLEPDDFKAYVSFDICRALPSQIGPEMNGKVFGFHPEVLANSYTGLLHQQTNIGHQMKVYGTADRDKINGCIIGVAYPKPSIGMGSKWDLPDKPEDAPSIRCLAVMFKTAYGVDKLLGGHLSNRKKKSVSIESSYDNFESAIFDTESREFHNIYDVVSSGSELCEAIEYSEKTGLSVKPFNGRNYILAAGGESGKVGMRGVGYVDNAAEKSAKVNQVMACQHNGGLYNVLAASAPTWHPGQIVKWSTATVSCKGRGMVLSVHHEGVIKNRWGELMASSSNPVLRIQLDDSSKTSIIRYANEVVLGRH